MSSFQKKHLSEIDEMLQEEILGKLKSDQRTAGSEIRVGVLNHFAHLGGKVDCREVRTAVETIDIKVMNVRSVVDRIQAAGNPAPAWTIHLDLNHKKKKCINTHSVKELNDH